MSKATYIGVNDVARKVKKIYIGLDNVARKVKKGYIGVNGVARLFYSSAAFVSYSGDYDVGVVQTDDGAYLLYTLKTSGTLVLDDSVDAWMCGGGGGGANGTYTPARLSGGSYNYSTVRAKAGGGGGGGYATTLQLPSGSHIVSIGAGGSAGIAGTATTIGNTTVNGGNSGDGANGGVGGSGGGAAGNNYIGSNDETDTRSGGGSVGVGDGISKYPFGITSLKTHSAGGGGGTSSLDRYDEDKGVSVVTRSYGGYGGTNGSNGTGIRPLSSTDYQRENGGEYGGGIGGYSSSQMATAGTFYGAGGGGAYSGNGTNTFENSSATFNGGSGYQGVVYLLIPAESRFTITGNPVVCHPLEASAVDVEAEFKAVQSGSGTPSVDNVRAINGYNALTLMHNTTTHSVSLDEPVYGGTFDWNTGLLTITHTMVTLNGTETWYYADNNGDPYCYTDDTACAPGSELICDHFPQALALSGNANTSVWVNSSKGRYGIVALHKLLDSPSRDNFVAWLQNNPVNLVYKLATPEVVHLSQFDIKAVAGENTFTSNANTLTVTGYMS